MLEKLKEKYKTQTEIAKAVGVSQMAVSKWLSGKTFPSRRTAQKIAKVLGVPVSDIYMNSDLTVKQEEV